MGCEPSKEASLRSSRREANQQKLRDLRAYQSEALEREAVGWLEADEECRAASRPPRHGDTANPWVVEHPSPGPSALRARGRKKRSWGSGPRVGFSEGEDDVILTPHNNDVGPMLFREMHWTEGEFSDMFRQRKLLAIKAARYVRQHPNELFQPDGTPKPVIVGESRRGMGISPWEEAILGNREARNERIKKEHEKIFKYQRQATKPDMRADVWQVTTPGSLDTSRYQASSDPSNTEGVSPNKLYEAIARRAMDESSGVFQINQENAEAAHELAVKEHELLMATFAAEAPRADVFTRLSRRAKCLAKAQRRDSKTIATKTDRASLLAVCDDGKVCDHERDDESLAMEAIHQDQFVNLLRADSFNHHDDESGSRTPSRLSMVE